MARAARAGEASREAPAFSRAKRATGRYYMTREPPATRTLLARMQTGAQPVMALDPEAF